MEFYEWNTGRAYPLVQNTSFVPDSALVACGFIAGPGSGFVDGEHRVYLSTVRLNGSQIEFYFVSDAPGLVDEVILFTRSISDPQYVTEYAEAVEGSSLSDDLGCRHNDKFVGYLVTGPLTELLIALAASSNELEGESVVEPALIQNLSEAFIRSLNVANGDRTRYSPAEDCPDVEWPTEQQPLYVRRTCLQGPVRFKEGYNMSLRQSQRERALTFDATVGGGLGEPCEQIPLFEGEEPPADSELLDGGPGCADVFRTINGVGGRIVSLSSGLGTSISFIPAQASIVIDVNGHDMTVCSPTLQTPAESLNCDSISESVEGDAGN